MLFWIISAAILLVIMIISVVGPFVGLYGREDRQGTPNVPKNSFVKEDS
ncbi:MAG: hypothetical protein GX376_04425 [Firmicutes bacterium]|nr:hypothetical protein [Bacillota bacterium]